MLSMFAYYMFSHMGTNIEDTFHSCLEIKTTSDLVLEGWREQIHGQLISEK